MPSSVKTSMRMRGQSVMVAMRATIGRSSFKTTGLALRLLNVNRPSIGRLWVSGQAADVQIDAPWPRTVKSGIAQGQSLGGEGPLDLARQDRKSTRLNSSHSQISY